VRLRLTTTDDDDKQCGDKKDKGLASRSKAARDFGTAWRSGHAAAGVPEYLEEDARKDDCGE